MISGIAKPPGSPLAPSFCFLAPRQPKQRRGRPRAFLGLSSGVAEAPQIERGTQ